LARERAGRGRDHRPTRLHGHDNVGMRSQFRNPLQGFDRIGKDSEIERLAPQISINGARAYPDEATIPPSRCGAAGGESSSPVAAKPMTGRRCTSTMEMPARRQQRQIARCEPAPCAQSTSRFENQVAPPGCGVPAAAARERDVIVPSPPYFPGSDRVRTFRNKTAREEYARFTGADRTGKGMAGVRRRRRAELRDGMRVGEAHRVAIHRRNGVRWLSSAAIHRPRERGDARLRRETRSLPSGATAAPILRKRLFDGNHRTRRGAHSYRSSRRTLPAGAPMR